MYTLFLFHVVEIKLNVRSTGSDFQDTGPFSKLPYLSMILGHWPKLRDTGPLSTLPYLSMKLGHWAKSFRSCTYIVYSLSTPRCRNWSYFRSTGSGFRDKHRFSKLPYFFHETWPLKFSLSSLYGHQCPRYGPFFKIAIFVAWNLSIGQSARSCTYTLFLYHGVELSLFLFYGQRFTRYRPIFKIVIFGHEPQCSRSCIYSP